MASGQLGAVFQHIHRVAGCTALADYTDGQLLERFLSSQEEAAFTVLVRRHGSMVLGVCRRILRDRHAAEDAFQATFLVLLRRARYLDRRGSVASWLYTVAYHIALRARADAARRYLRERPVQQPPETEVTPATAWSDLQPILDEELQRLPETYRAVVVLCDLEDRTNAEAARLLGCPVGTVKGRLSRARELLRGRLTRRGITLSGTLLTIALANRAPAAVSGVLVHATLRTALASEAGVATVSANSATAITLAEGALRTMFSAKLKSLAVLLVILGVAALSLGTYTYPAQAQQQVQIQLKVQRPGGAYMPKGPASKAGRKIGTGKEVDAELAGRVVGPDGKAVAGADVVVLIWQFRSAPRVLKQARTDRHGNFSFKVRRPPPEQSDMVVFSSAKGHGIGWHWPHPGGKADIQLEPEATIRGRLIDLQGQPAANVQLDVVRLGSRGFTGLGEYILVSNLGIENDDENDPYLSRGAPRGKVEKDGTVLYWDEVKKESTRTPPRLVLPEPPAKVPGWPGSVTTDAQGRFVLRGIPKGRDIGLRVRDPRFALQAVALPAAEKSNGEEITRVLSPVRVIEGTVMDADSGKPIPHARLKVHSPTGRLGVVFADSSGQLDADARGRRGLGMGARTLAFALRAEVGLPDEDDLPPLEVQADAKGHFRLNLFRAGSYTIRITAPAAEPYLPRMVRVRWPQQAVVRKEVNVSLIRGVTVRGRVTEAPGDKAVAGARVDFWSKGLKLPEGVRHPRSVLTGPDGKFEALLPPASWHLLVNGMVPVYLYQPIAIAKLTDKTQGLPQLGPVVKDNKAAKANKNSPKQFYPDAWVTLDVKPEDAPRDITVTLKRAPLLRGRVVGPDGKPAKGVRLIRRPAQPFEEVVYTNDVIRRVFLDLTGTAAQPHHFIQFRDPEPVELVDGTFSLPVLDPKESYCLHFLDAKRNLGAVVELKGKQAGTEPVTVQLSLTGSARVRLVDSAGKPRANYRPLLWLLLPPGPHPVPKSFPEFSARGVARANALFAAHLRPGGFTTGPTTNPQGRVTLSGLIPGATYRLLLDGGKARDFTVRSGETLELGDLTVAEIRPAAKLPEVRKTKTK